ncbi:MAG: hypothetical protein RR225_09915 [Clostridium sp.]
MKEYTKENKDMFMEGLQRYVQKGVKVSIDNEDFQPEDYEKLIEIREDGSFYMGDYIESNTGKLTEIHFDRVYYN